MAVKKTASPTKAGATAKTKSAPKAAAPAKAAAKAAPKTTAPAAKAAASKAAAKTSAAAPKPAGKAQAAKKKAAPKLSPTQADLLGRVGGAGEAGYLGDKKAEQRTLEALRERKLIKRGAKNKETGHFPYQVSNAGKSHLQSSQAAEAPAPAAAPSGAATTPSSGGNA